MVLSFKKIIGNKLALSFLLILLVFISFGIIILEELPTLGDLTRIIYRHPLVVSNASLRAALNVSKMQHSMDHAVLAYSPAEIEDDLKAVAEAEAAVYLQLDIIQKNILGEEGQALEKQTRQLFVEWIPIRTEAVRLLKAGNREDAILINKGKGNEHVAMLENKMLELTSYARNKATDFMKQAAASQSKLQNVVRMTVAFVVLSVVFVFFAINRLLKAEKILRDEKRELQKALEEIKTLRGIIPICSYCKQIRDDKGLWKQMEEYIRAHSEAEFSHGICPDCMKKIYSEDIKKILQSETQEK